MPFDETAAKLGLETSEYLELVNLFVEASEADLRRLQHARKQGSLGEVAEAAHSIKGAAHNLMFDDIRRLAEILETDARRNSLESFDENLEAIINRVSEIARSVRVTA